MTDIVARMMALPDLTNEKAWETIYEGAREIERLRQALEDISNPMATLQRSAESEGAILNRNAVEIANNIGYLQSIARAAPQPAT